MYRMQVIKLSLVDLYSVDCKYFNIITCILDIIILYYTIKIIYNFIYYNGVLRLIFLNLI